MKNEIMDSGKIFVHSPNAERIYDFIENGRHKTKFEGLTGIGYSPKHPDQFYIVFHENLNQNLANLNLIIKEENFQVSRISEPNFLD